MLERRLDRLPLRVEDALLRPDEDGRLHPSTTFGLSRYASNGIVVSRSNASTYFARVCATTSVGQLGAGVGLVPAGLLAVVADELLVEAVLRAARLVRVRGPEARRVGRQRLVAEHELAVGVEAELELRVGDDDPARRARARRRVV